jgi:hypothetical protein
MLAQITPLFCGIHNNDDGHIKHTCCGSMDMASKEKGGQGVMA